MTKLTSPKPWLILFDIDDTLIHRVNNSIHIGLARWAEAIKVIYKINLDLPKLMLLKGRWDGMVDYQIGWDLLKPYQITRQEYDQKFPQVRDVLFAVALNHEKKYGNVYQLDPESKKLLDVIIKYKDIKIALLTGNLEKIGWWKLRQCGLDHYFKYGWFADNVKSREEIAQNALHEARTKFSIDFKLKQISVIGDTVHDIACGKSIQVNTIGLTVGRDGAKEKLYNAGANIVADSLTDPVILNWFNISI
jgi:phosphoglycolate phosphatase